MQFHIQIQFWYLLCMVPVIAYVHTYVDEAIGYTVYMRFNFIQM